ncbi:MAG: ribosome assembly RNA-binding protein YhbY [Gammaproteobacteria bacterium]|nr:ribosome assembly RNA-binding protein YhbY [Gammaproteobacteria bacterium]
MLNKNQITQLKSRAHHLKPVVTTGQAGLTDAVLEEIEIALNHHELIKVKVRSGDRDDRKQIINSIQSKTQSDIIQVIGQIAVLYRKNPDNHG